MILAQHYLKFRSSQLDINISERKFVNLNINLNGLAPTLLAPTYVSIYVLSTDG